MAETVPNSALPPGGDAKYVEQMLARADQVDPNVVESVEEKDRATNNVQVETDKDKALLAGKYKTQEDLVKGYEELQRKLSELTAKKPAAVGQTVLQPPG